MSHSLCVMGMYDEVKVTVPMIVRYVHNDKITKKNVTLPPFQEERPRSKSVRSSTTRTRAPEMFWLLAS
jgi:hypothetical protein